MTICIAAQCKYGEEERIIICADTRVSSPLGMSDAGDKLWEFTDKEKHKWHGLSAGSPTDAYESVRQILDYLEDKVITDVTVAEAFREPLQMRKRRMIESLVRGRWGLGYD